MSYQVLDEAERLMDAHLDLDTSAIVFHSRGGSRGRSNSRNQDYGPALRLILERIAAARLNIDGAWVDSTRVQSLPLDQRIVLSPAEMSDGAPEAFRLMSSRMKDVGRTDDGPGGNPTKRIRIQLSSDTPLPELVRILRVTNVQRDFRSTERLPAEELEKVTAEHIWMAVQKLMADPANHHFGQSTDFDLMTTNGDRLPSKAVFGVAASIALGFEVLPKHFIGGKGTPAFKALEAAGYSIVPKGEAPPITEVPASEDDREWSEGRPRLVNHLKRERASGLSQAKKENFKRINGRLFCERCGMDPINVYEGAHGEACIEVHHKTTHVSAMSDGHGTRLEDLQCLCANCHRVTHRQLRVD
jgi:hypothetical protein